MEIVSPHEYINALSALSKIVFAKKYSFRDFDPQIPPQNKLALEINSEFKSELGFDITEASNLEDVNTYENRLDLEFSKVTSEKIIKYPIEDEIELLKSARKSSNEHFKEFDISITPAIKDLVAKLKFNIPSLRTMVRTANQVFIISSKDRTYGENILMLNTCRFLSKDYNLFLHLHENKREDKMLEIKTCLMAKKDFTENFNPVRFFLFVLTKYGVLLRINNKSKKFFLEEQIIVKTLNSMDIIKPIIEGKNPTTLYVNSSMKFMHFYAQVNFAYGIYSSRYLNDLRAGNI